MPASRAGRRAESPAGPGPQVHARRDHPGGSRLRQERGIPVAHRQEGVERRPHERTRPRTLR